MLFINIVVLIGLFRILKVTESPLLCAGIYASYSIAMAYFYQQTILPLLLPITITSVLAFIWFWLLNRFDSGWRWWVVFILGLCIGIF